MEYFSLEEVGSLGTSLCLLIHSIALRIVKGTGGGGEGGRGGEEKEAIGLPCCYGEDLQTRFAFTAKTKWFICTRRNLSLICLHTPSPERKAKRVLYILEVLTEGVSKFRPKPARVVYSFRRHRQETLSIANTVFSTTKILPSKRKT